MSRYLTDHELDEIWKEAGQHCPPVTSIDRVETIYSISSTLGSFYHREIELYPGLELCIHHDTYHEDLTVKGSENEHLVQFQVLLSGVVDAGSHVLINAEQSYIGGSGIQPSHQYFSPQAQPLVGVNIHMQPQLLSQLFAAPTGDLSTELQPLVRGDDWQQRFSPELEQSNETAGCCLPSVARRCRDKQYVDKQYVADRMCVAAKPSYSSQFWLHYRLALSTLYPCLPMVL